MDENKIKVLVVDDHPVVAEGTIALISLDPNITVIGKAVNGNDCIEQTKKLKPDVILLDINLPDICGIDLVETLRCIHNDVKILMFTGQSPDAYLVSSMDKGVNGFLLKDCNENELIQAIHKVVKGEVFFSQSMGIYIKSLLVKTNIKEDGIQYLENQKNTLTTRELQIMDLVSKGYRNKEIAIKLKISIRTVDYHVSNILSKLGVTNRLEAVLKWKTR